VLPQGYLSRQRRRLPQLSRFASDEKPPEGSGKYLLPKGFHKQLVLYNLNRVRGRNHLVLVEGFFGVFRLHTLGVPAVALMGCSLSDEQITVNAV
jgi:hypothetical protein